MRIGLNWRPPHRSPEDWAEILSEMGFRAASLPVDGTADPELIQSYVEAAAAHDIMLAEVGIWAHVHSRDPEEREAARQKSFRQLALADRLGIPCCGNISGADGPVWCGCYAANYSPELYRENIRWIRELIDTVRPTRTWYTVEPMQWMVPDSPQSYRKLIEDVDRDRFAVHLDMINFVNNPYRYTHMEELMDECIDLLGPQIRSIHLKDCLQTERLTVAYKEVTVGTGAAPVRYFLEKIAELEKKTGRELPVLLEHLNDMDKFKASMNYLQEAAGDLIGKE